MELAQLSDRALQIHAAFAERARRTGKRPWTREQVMQGFVGDVGDLMKLVMAKAGARPIAEVDRQLAHELSDCLWSVLVLAQLYGVNLEREFPRTMDTLERKLQTPKRLRPSKDPRGKPRGIDQDSSKSNCPLCS